MKKKQNQQQKHQVERFDELAKLMPKTIYVNRQKKPIGFVGKEGFSFEVTAIEGGKEILRKVPKKFQSSYLLSNGVIQIELQNQDFSSFIFFYEDKNEGEHVNLRPENLTTETQQVIFDVLKSLNCLAPTMVHGVLK